MSHPAFDPARREVWYTDGTSGFYVLHLDNSAWPDPTAVATPSCAAPSGRLGGLALGPVKLGQTRASARKLFLRSETRGRRDSDYFCLAGTGIRDGYPSARLLRTLSARQRRRVSGRVILLLSANPYYALDAVRPGTRVATVARRLRLGKGFKVGLNTWYLAPGKPANGVLKVRHGVIEEVGIADKRLTSDRSAARRFFKSFS